MTDDVDRIIAKGAPITLIDGTKTHIRFGMLGTRQLTKKYGSLGRLQDLLELHFGRVAKLEGEEYEKAEKEGLTDEALDLLMTLRAAGLSHLGFDEFELDEALAHLSWMDQMEPIFDAFSLSLGGDEKEAKGPKDHKGKGGTTRSRSKNSGPTAPLKAVEPMSNSGT